MTSHEAPIAPAASPGENGLVNANHARRILATFVHVDESLPAWRPCAPADRPLLRSGRTSTGRQGRCSRP